MTEINDSFRHKGLRKKLVEMLRDKGIVDKNVLQAIEKVPRHLFLDSSFMEFAYEDRAFAIGFGQTISQPYTVAFQTSLLEITSEDKILEIGTGSGYQSCVLLELGAKVFSIERQKSLYTKTKQLLPSIGYNPKFFYGDGYKGLPAFAPFDKILVTAGAPYIPDALIEQLKIGGKLVIPVGEGNTQIMIRIIKTNDREFLKEEHGNFRFVPLLKDKTHKDDAL